MSIELEIPAFSAGDLISSVNGEIYGVNKNVANKFKNQDILSQVVCNQLRVNTQILLAGHFCIFDREYKVDCLPESIFEYLDMESILLLEADLNRVIENLSNRDKKNYTHDQLSALAEAEQEAAQRVAKKIGCNLLIHKMQFKKDDIIACISKIKGGYN
jgi:adenylate kinase